MARVLIEVPTYDGRIAPCTSESLWRLDTDFHQVDYHARQGYGCAMARNRIAADTLNAGYDYVLMVDNDIELPRDALTNLMEHELDVCLGFYLNRYTRGEGRYTCLFKQGPGWVMYTADELRDMRESGETLVRVGAGGMGCALVKASVFEKLQFPWFEWTDLSRIPLKADDVYGCRDAFNSGGEDVNFCINASNAGIPIYADPRVACGHEFRTVHYA